MLSWKLDAIINIALVGFALWVRRRPRARRALRPVVFAYAALLVASSFVGVALGVLVSLDPFAGETSTPSQGTLAVLGFSEPVSSAATGITAFLLPTVAASIMFRRSRDVEPVAPS